VRWRLDYDAGGPGAVHVSEFADIQPAPSSHRLARREAYGRPVNKRDLGHRCYGCRRPFSTLGGLLIAELQGGPAQRFHPDCWQKRNSSRTLGSLGRSAGSAAGGAEAAELAPGQSQDTPDVVAAYTEEWRRASMEANRWPCSRQRARPTTLRKSELVRHITVEDEHGDRRVARGFTRSELQAATGQWAAGGTANAAGEECPICYGNRKKPLQLPCGHKFCSECVEPWLRRCAICPMCREELRPPPGARPVTSPSARRRARSAGPAVSESWGLRIRPYLAIFEDPRGGARTPTRPALPSARGFPCRSAFTAR